MYKTGATYGFTSLIGVDETGASEVSRHMVADALQGPDALELVAVCEHLELAAVIVALECNEMCEAPDRAGLVLPAGAKSIKARSRS